MVEQGIAIVGPTASGKSGLALALACERDCEIVNADALQAYRGLDLGTAKPTREERTRVPHHLVDVLDPGERWSAGEFARAAREAIAEIAARGRLPIVVGGSGLYLRALWSGIAEIPPVPEPVRVALARRLAEEGLGTLTDELRRVDPTTAARLAAGDTQRTLRALEVHAATGRPLSAWLADPVATVPVPLRRFGLTLPRALLYDRIAVRVGRMVEQGWVEEVRRLLSLGHEPTSPAFQAIGYRQIVDHLRGETSLAESVAGIVTATRQYAKRQLTWFRREPEIAWLDATQPELALDHLLAGIAGI